MSESKFQLVCGEDTILREIVDKSLHQRDVAQTYRLIMESAERTAVDWAKINTAIIERWSKSGLVRIKEMAWSGKCAVAHAGYCFRYHANHQRQEFQQPQAGRPMPPARSDSPPASRDVPNTIRWLNQRIRELEQEYNEASQQDKWEVGPALRELRRVRQMLRIESAPTGD